LTKIKALPLSLTHVKKRTVFANKITGMFVRQKKMPYFCIVNQKELMTRITIVRAFGPEQKVKLKKKG